MKILLLPCHSILEYDEMRLWLEMGHEVFSLGSYVNPATPHDLKRPPIPEGKYEEYLVGLAGLCSKDNLCPELIEPFDVIMVHHVSSWIINNWDKIKHKKVVWRTIGQSIASYELGLQPYREQGLKVVRYSPKEDSITMNIGTDALIRFYKDPVEFNGWNGNINQVITLGQAIRKRGVFTHYDVFDRVTTGLPRAIYGSNNDDIIEWKGQLDYEPMKQVLRDNRVFFYTGTQPASYTLGFIEAMMTGIPIVAIGKDIGNSIYRLEQDTYEIPDIIINGQNGFCTDNEADLRDYVNLLLNNEKVAKQISEEGRKRAIDLFGKEKIKKEWEAFFAKL